MSALQTIAPAVVTEVAHLRRAAVLVGKILKGAKPADLTVEHVSTFDLVISQRTAKACGITIAQAVLDRTDTVIE